MPLTTPPRSGDDRAMGQQLRVRIKRAARLRRKKRIKAKTAKKRTSSAKA